MAEKYPGGPPPQEPPPPYTPPTSNYPPLPGSYPPPPQSYPPPPANYAPPPAGYAPPPGGFAPPPGGAGPTGPPPGGYPHPPGHQTTVIVTSGGPPPKVMQQAKPKRRGLMGSLVDGVESLGRQLGKEVDYCTKHFNTTWAQYTTSTILTQFTTGSVVQLLSRSTGRCLQVVALSTGQLILDGMGNLDPQYSWNTLWTVINEGKNQVRLHNNNNYLALVQGVTQVTHMLPGAPLGIETKFQLCKTHDDFVMLESAQETGRFVAILPNGQLKPALSAGRDMHSHFGLKVVSTPYVNPGQMNYSTNTTVKKYP